MSDRAVDGWPGVVDVRPGATAGGGSTVEIGFRPAGGPRQAIVFDLDDPWSLRTLIREELVLDAVNRDDWALDVRAVDVATASFPWEEWFSGWPSISGRVPHLWSSWARRPVRRILVAVVVPPDVGFLATLRSRLQTHMNVAFLSARPQSIEVGVVAPAALVDGSWPDGVPVLAVPDDAPSILDALGSIGDLAWDALHLVGNLGSRRGVPALDALAVADAADHIGAWAVAAFDWQAYGHRDVAALADRLARTRPGLAAGIDATHDDAEAVEQMIAIYQGQRPSIPRPQYRRPGGDDGVLTVYTPPAPAPDEPSLLLFSGRDERDQAHDIRTEPPAPVPVWAAAIERRWERWDALTPQATGATATAVREGIAEARRLVDEAIVAAARDDGGDLR